jgi:catechol 2,3-dioxygenase-like lactoylglutathione lyase family enzyme
MFKGIDHLVIVVNDLEEAAKDYEQLGFRVVPGGRHPVGSHNALISFADGSYIEIIAFYREALDHRWWGPLLKGERLVDYCLQTDDLRGDTQKLRDAGVTINDPVPWSRTRPDGYELKWLLSLATGGHRGTAPFLIQDITAREARIPRECAHSNGVTGIHKLTVVTGEIATLERWYQAVLGMAGQRIEDQQLQANGVRFAVGPHLLEFLSPLGPQSELANWMRMYGPSPYSALLQTNREEKATLDLRLSHGAHLHLTNTPD